MTPMWFVMAVAVGLVIVAPLFANALNVALEKRLRERTLRMIARARQTTGAAMSDPMRAPSTKLPRDGEP